MTSLDAAAQAVGGPWGLVIVAALPSVGSGIWVVWRWMADRSDKHHEAEESREERMARLMDEQRAAMSREQAEMFDDLRGENKGLRERLAETERDRNRGWDLARYWHGRAQDLLRLFRNMRHDLLNARQIIGSLFERYIKDTAAPTMDPVPPVPDLPMGLEEPRGVGPGE